MTGSGSFDFEPNRRRGSVALPALAAGVGLALSLPPWGFWILAFPSAGLLWWRLGGLRPRTRLWAGWLAGLGCYVPGLAFARSFTLIGAIVLIALEALFIGAACLAVPRGPVVARALAFPAAMTLAEAARQSWPFGGLPIGGVFLGQADGPLLGVARVGGPLLLTAVVYLAGVGVGALGEAAVGAWGNHGSATGIDSQWDRPGSLWHGGILGPTGGADRHRPRGRRRRGGDRGDRSPSPRWRAIGRNGDRGRRPGRWSARLP